MQTETCEQTVARLSAKLAGPVPGNLVSLLRDCALVRVALVHVRDPGWIAPSPAVLGRKVSRMTRAVLTDLRDQDLVWWATGVYRESGHLDGSGYRTTVAGQTAAAAAAAVRWDGASLDDRYLWKRVKKDGRAAAQMLACKVYDTLAHRSPCRCSPYEWTRDDVAAELGLPERHALAALEHLGELGVAERVPLIGMPCPKRTRQRMWAWRDASRGTLEGTLP